MLATIESFGPGQNVKTSFGTGVISSISYVDSIIYVTLSKRPSALYLFRPEQIEAIAPLTLEEDEPEP